MAAHDPFWGMPQENWQPTSSFNVPISPPVDDPLAAPLVQLPCVNVQWVPIILGCLAQLTDPGVWLTSLTDDERSAVLNRVDNLRSSMSGTVSTPCCDVTMRLTATCELQWSTDGGTTWSTVSGWDANFGPCIRANFPNPVPPNPGPLPPNQHACNIAGYLATDIIKVAMEKVVAYVGTTQQQVKFATDVLQVIGYAFPITYAASIAFQDWYNSIVGQLLSQVEAARDDPALWAEVTCAIYNAIKNTGYVTAANFNAVHTNLAAMSYVYAWVPGVIAAWWNDMGLANIQQAQSVGALDVVDCTGCGTWCFQFDFTAGTQGFTAFPIGGFGPGAVWTSGVGWTSVIDAGQANCDIQIVLPQPMTITHGNITFTASQPKGAGSSRFYRFLSGGVTVGQIGIDPNAEAAPVHSSTGAISIFCDTILLIMQSDTGGSIIVSDFQLSGNGPDPFGLDNCTY